ncbi:MAG TPA: hypothetical protein VNC50_14650, partial [Planctomycetia bacterium]|nr:hypothetical protein [Planctomycetia bacterium]
MPAPPPAKTGKRLLPIAALVLFAACCAFLVFAPDPMTEEEKWARQKLVLILRPAASQPGALEIVLQNKS